MLSIDSQPAAAQTTLGAATLFQHAPPQKLSQNKAVADASAGPSTPSPQLVNAAHEFEASLMQELMAPLLPGHETLDGEEDAGSSSALSAFAGEAFGKALSERGGLGIATRIIHQLNQTGNHSGKTPVPKPPASIAPKAVSL